MALKCTQMPHLHRRRHHARRRPWRIPESRLQTRLSRSSSVRLSVRLTNTPLVVFLLTNDEKFAGT